MISGDAHMAALDDGPGFPVLHAAPLDRRTQLKGGPYSHGVSTRRGQFGLLDVEDDGATLTAGLSGRNQKGEVISGLALALRCDEGGCAVLR